VAGPFGDEGKWIGLFIFDCETKEEVEKLLKTDPAIAAGRLNYEIHPWWTAASGSFTSRQAFENGTVNLFRTKNLCPVTTVNGQHHIFKSSIHDILAVTFAAKPGIHNNLLR